MRYLITGATGDVGARVVRILIQAGERPRVFVRNESKARSLFGDCVDVFVGDLSNPKSLKPALSGVESLFLVATGPEIPMLDANAAAVAKQAGVRHLVKLSSMDVEQGLAIGAWHEQGEAAIRASGVPFTFIRPSGFMSNLLAWAGAIKSEGVVRSSTGDGRRPFIHSDDIAAVAVQALTTRDYVGQALALTGPAALTFAEITEKVGATIGCKLRYEPIADDEAGRRFRTTGASEPEVEAHVALWRAIREGRLAAVTPIVEEILGRPPIAIDQWLAENADAFMQQERANCAIA